jgi:hypothetical protein
MISRNKDEEFTTELKIHEIKSYSRKAIQDDTHI